MKKNKKFKTKLGHHLYKAQRDTRYALTDTAKRLWAYKSELGTLALTGAMIFAIVKTPEWKEKIEFKQAENRMARANYYEKEIDSGKFTPEVAEAISKQIEKDREDYWFRVKMREERAKSK